MAVQGWFYVHGKVHINYVSDVCHNLHGRYYRNSKHSIVLNRFNRRVMFTDIHPSHFEIPNFHW